MVQEEGTSVKKGLGNKIDDLAAILKEQQQTTKKKKKEFKLPLGVRSGAKSKIKKNYAMIIKLSTNGALNFKLLQILPNGMVYLKENNTYHQVTAGDIFWYKNYPTVILPEWSLKPFSAKDHYDKTVKDKMLASPQRIIIDAIKESQIKGKGFGGMNLKVYLVIGIVVIVALAYLTQGFGGG